MFQNRGHCANWPEDNVTWKLDEHLEMFESEFINEG